MQRSLLFFAFTLALCVLLSLGSSFPISHAQQPLNNLAPAQPTTPPPPRTLDDFDIRATLRRALTTPDEEPVNRAALSGARSQARTAPRATRLARALPQAELRWSSLSQTPSRVLSFEQPLTEASRASSETIARTFLKNNQDLFHLNATEIDGLALARRIEDDRQVGHMRRVTLQQQVSGIDVFGGEYNISLAPTGAVVAASGELIDQATAAINATRATLPVEEALRRAARAAETEVTGDLPTSAATGRAQVRQIVNAGGASVFGRAVEARLVYFPLAQGQLRLAWEFTLWMRDTADAYLLVIDAESGSLLYRFNLTSHCFALPSSKGGFTAEGAEGRRGEDKLSRFASVPVCLPLRPSAPSAVFSSSLAYRFAALNFGGLASTLAAIAQTGPRGLVYTQDSPRPNVPFATNNPALVPRELVTFGPAPFNGRATFVSGDPHFDWWAGGAAMGLVSNNVDAHLDRDNNDRPDTPLLTVADGNFSFPVDLGGSPTTEDNQRAAEVNLFYWVNRYHDILYSFGFTESAGNFQTNNFGLGGAGNDAVQADAQDGSGTNNANFSTPRDGSPGRVQMYLWTGTPQRDGDFDQGVIVHELTHGLSNRLVGNATGLSGMQARGMGEGWSDYFGLTLVTSEDADLNGSYPVGQFATNNYTGGIRRFPYSTSAQIYPLNFGDIRRSTEVHNVGEIWCNTLLDMRATLIGKLGYREGQRQSIQLVVDGLKLTPNAPSFIDARNAIMLADRVNNGGANQCLLWQAFARHGLGWSAVTLDGGDSAPDQAFDPPPFCSDLGVLRLDQKSYLVGETIKLTLGDHNAPNAPGAVRVEVRSMVTGDVETVTLAADTVYAGSYTGSLRVVMGPARPGDGALQASLQAGDKITLTYLDIDNGAGATAQVVATTEVTGEVELFKDSVDAGNRGWSATGVGAPWAITSAKFASPPRAWTDSPDGNYASNADASLVSPTLDLSQAKAVTLAFAHSYSLETNFDYGNVEYSRDDGATWQRATAFTGTLSAFTQARVRLDALAGEPRARVRFRLLSDASGNQDGWTIDDIRVIGRAADSRLLPTASELAPMVTSVSPAFGAPAGGAAVTIFGANFTEAGDVRVFFDEIPATGVRVISGNSVAATAPAHTAGAVTVRVATRYGSGALANAFTYHTKDSIKTAPVLTNIFPGTGSTKGVTGVTLSGSNFTPDTVVKFGTQTARVTFINATTLQAIAPANSAGGTVDIIATNPTSSEARLVGAFTYRAPTPPTIALLAPSGGEHFFAGATVVVRWRSSDDHAVAKHRVELIGGAQPQTLASELPGEAQSFNWQIPASTAAGTQVSLRVTAVDDEGEETTVNSNSFVIDRRWERLAALPAALQRVAVVSDGRVLYAIGGRQTSSSTSSVATVQRLNPSDAPAAWSSAGIAPLPTALNAGDAVAINGRIYLPGGINGITALDPTHFVYDIAGNAWSNAAAAPQPTYLYALAADGERGFLMTGGITESGSVSAAVQAYDIATNAWQQLPPMHTARFAHETALIDGKLYIVGGNGTAGGLDDGEIYNFQTGQWTAIASLNRPRRYAASAVARDAAGKAYWLVIGGEDATTLAPLNSVEAYDSTANRWIVLDGSFALPSARTFLGAATLGGFVYVVGGSSANTGTTQSITERLSVTGFNLLGANQPPLVVVPAGEQIAIPGFELSFNVAAQDLGLGAALTLAAGALPTGATFTPAPESNGSTRAVFRWMPSVEDVGRVVALNFTASDGELSDVKTVMVRVVAAAPLATVGAADYRGGPLAPDSIASIFGTGLAARIESAQALPPPTSLAGTSVTLNGLPAQLFFVSPTQINFAVPARIEMGRAVVVVSSALGSYSVGTIEIAAAAPALFTLDSTGRGDAAAQATVDGINYQTQPFDVMVNGRPNVLVLYGTGFRRAPAAKPDDEDGVAEAVTATIDGRAARVLYAGAQGGLAGLDQINVELPASLAGTGPRRVEVALSVNGGAANRVTVQIK